MSSKGRTSVLIADECASASLPNSVGVGPSTRCKQNKITQSYERASLWDYPKDSNYNVHVRSRATSVRWTLLSKHNTTVFQTIVCHACHEPIETCNLIAWPVWKSWDTIRCRPNLHRLVSLHVCVHLFFIFLLVSYQRCPCTRAGRMGAFPAIQMSCMSASKLLCTTTTPASKLVNKPRSADS
jgi:hypothetical protein